MALTITREQRDALYSCLMDRLRAIEDIDVAVGSREFSTADRLAGEYSEDLLLIRALVAGEGGVIELDLDGDVLARVFDRLRDSARAERGREGDGWREDRSLDDRNRLVAEACANVLGSLEV